MIVELAVSSRILDLKRVVMTKNAANKTKLATLDVMATLMLNFLSLYYSFSNWQHVIARNLKKSLIQLDANLLSILLLFNWLTLEYIDQSDFDNKFQSIPIAFKAVVGTFLGVAGCISVSKLRNSAFMQTERQLFKSDEIESQRSSLVS